MLDTQSAQSKLKKPTGPLAVQLLPDITILVQARILAGEKSLRIREMANFIMHDPVLSLEFMQFANSTLFAGSPVFDVEGALNRLGTERLIQTLATLNVKATVSEETAEMVELIRYNCRRVSMVSLIVATACRPALSVAARLSGLYADIGHMVALLHLGDVYCEIVKTKGRKNVPFRLEKDHQLKLEKLLPQYLRSKGLPEKLILPYDDEQQAKAAADIDLRCCVRSAQELIDAFDSGKLASYAPDGTIPARSNLRLLKLNAAQHTRIYKATADYLKLIAEHEAPENSSLLLSSVEDESTVELGSDSSADTMRVPKYPDAPVNSKSRAQMQDFYSLCESAGDEGSLKIKAVEYLRQSGLFERAALIRVPQGANDGIIDYATGFDKRAGDKIPINDPLSPLNLFRMEIKSTNVKSDSMQAPFGVAAYAIGPVDVNAKGDKVLLYTDHSGHKSLSMESRRVFRMAVGLLMRSFEALRQGAKPEAS